MFSPIAIIAKITIATIVSMFGKALKTGISNRTFVPFSSFAHRIG